MHTQLQAHSLEYLTDLGVSHEPSPQVWRDQSSVKVIHLTYMSREAVPAYVWDQYRRFALGYQIRFYNDTECLGYLLQNYPHLVGRYQQLKKGPHRADMFRYAVLHREGGGCPCRTPSYVSIHDQTLPPQPDLHANPEACSKHTFLFWGRRYLSRHQDGAREADR